MKRRSRQNIYYHFNRALIFLSLGRFCSYCRSVEKLEFDCIIPAGQEHHLKSSCSRMGFYWREFCRGNLQILCSRCNLKKSDKLILL